MFCIREKLLCTQTNTYFFNGQRGKQAKQEKETVQETVYVETMTSGDFLQLL